MRYKLILQAALPYAQLTQAKAATLGDMGLDTSANRRLLKNKKQCRWNQKLVAGFVQTTFEPTCFSTSHAFAEQSH